jgi:sirohydrochlorin ferrochelatase
MKIALLLIAHGSRQRAANADLDHVAEQLRLRGGGVGQDSDPAGLPAKRTGAESCRNDKTVFDMVETSFLELAEPTIPEGGRRCVVAGAERVVLLPYFLSAGVHVREDLQRHRDELAAAHREVEFLLAEPLGRHPLLIDVVLERAAQALAMAARREA